MKKSNTTKLFLFIAMLFILPLNVFSQGPPAVFVITENVNEMKFHDQITLVGRTQAVIESKIVSEISGRVQNINAEEGTFVKAGDPLITIDAERIYLSLQAKQAEAHGTQQRDHDLDVPILSP